MKTSHCHEQAQGLLFDIRSNHNREVGDLDYVLRDALWSSQNSAPNRVCLFAVLRAQITPAQHSACTLMAGGASLVTFIAGGPVLVFGTAVQVLLRANYCLWKEVAIA